MIFLAIYLVIGFCLFGVPLIILAEKPYGVSWWMFCFAITMTILLWPWALYSLKGLKK